MRTVPQIAYDFIKLAEACRLAAYQDSRGVWTIGWGHTGPEVVQGLTITLAQAVAYLAADVATAARRLAGVVRAERISALTDHEYAALLSFVFNLGADPGWTIWKLLNAGNLVAAQNEIPRFDHGLVSGRMVEIEGLRHRRLAEMALWSTPDAAAAAAIVQAAPVAAPPSSQTRDMDTPPIPAGTAKALSASKTFVAGCVSACAYAGNQFAPQIKGAADAVNGAITPYVGSSAVLQHVSTGLAVAGAAAAASVVFFAWLKNHQARTQ